VITSFGEGIKQARDFCTEGRKHSEQQNYAQGTNIREPPIQITWKFGLVIIELKLYTTE